MKRWRRLLLLATVTSLAALAVAAWVLWPRTAITRANVARIAVGMPLAEVETILGGPARDDTSGPVIRDYEADAAVGGEKARTDGPRRTFEWRSDHVMVLIYVDADNQVSEWFVFSMRPRHDGPLALVRAWLRL